MIANITEEYTILSEKISEFRRGNAFPSRIDTNDDMVPEAFRNYGYPVTAWPILINEEMTAQLMELSVKIPKLLQQIPDLYFNKNMEKIADFYFEGDEMMAELGMMCHEKNLELGCRLDLTYTEDGFKILEANIGSSLGGWQIQSLESVIRRNHPALSEKDHANHYRTRNTLQIYMNYLIGQVIKHIGKENKTLNLFVDMRDMEDGPEKQLNIAFFDDLFKQELAKFGLEGEACTGDMKALELISGNLYMVDKIIHSVIVLSLDSEISPAVFRAFIMDNVYFPDHLGLRMLGDKRNLSILRELALEGRFSPEENELILKNIPWTAPVGHTKTIFRQQEYDLPALLRDNREKFVIKASRGYQGKDVFVGKYLNDGQWQEALDLALTTDAFIAQEFSDSIGFSAPNEHNQWTPHKLIWGAFGFGDSYGGVWVRMSEVTSDVGVINSATGAVEAIVFEIID
ncbi:hypothetical protein [Flavobacterium humi]|uniref:Glutathionylspermidine synthase pre-ATP-grasp-like domain-containing protein n=1 Tax=Flavobacterium humi TaxID=2562683 RepID=A0A4Z0L535_9FLAO|nr:hypothetical protein [Flavobacterium humi]TGD57492.1 hypothetical protein E4635_09870 [Flavobacterium humi]